MKLAFSALVFLFVAFSNAYPIEKDMCNICVEFVVSSQNYLAKNNTAELVKIQLESDTDLYEMCNLFGKYTDDCKDDVKRFVTSFVELLTDDNYSSEEICAELGLCYEEDLGPAPVIIDCLEPENRQLEYCQHLIYENGPGVVPIIKPAEL
jgi:hypothetical protein